MSRELYIAWQSKDSRRWHTIGRLTHEQETGYHFEYLQGVKNAQEDRFRSIGAFPHLSRTYSSDTLFSFFQNRLISAGRPEFSDLVKQLGLQPIGDFESPQFVFEFLSRSRGWRATDSYELFAPISLSENCASWEFFTRGIRHAADCLRRDWISNEPEEPLMHAFTPTNDFDGDAILIVDQKQRSLGYVPGNYSSTIKDVLSNATDLEVNVIWHNREPELDRRRFLLRLHAQMPAEYSPPCIEELLPFDDSELTA